jgi:hypothetical protein
MTKLHHLLKVKENGLNSEKNKELQEKLLKNWKIKYLYKIIRWYKTRIKSST